MNPEQTWNIRTNDTAKTIRLYKNKVVVIKHFHSDDYKQTYSFNEILNYKYTLASHEIDYEILMNVVSQKKPNKLNSLEEKIWNFWSCFQNDKIQEERIFVDETSMVDF